MSIGSMMSEELRQEALTTRRFLERIPGDRLTWKPHEKSLSLGQLALHIADCHAQEAELATADRFPVPDVDGAYPQPDSTQQILAAFEANVRRATDILESMTDAQMQETWRLVAGEKELLAMPRWGVFRYILLNHIYHHRGQLGVYLRLIGAPVPSSYGPSGDEIPPEFAAATEATRAASR